MKYLSFSLWGDKPIYNIGAIKNAELWKEIYPEWCMVVYYNNTVPKNIINSLKELDVKLIDMSDSRIYGCFWRFLISDEDDCEYAVFRDCDSRISVREKMAVDEWLLSNKTLHVMRDHPGHGVPFGATSLGILAGMWGIKGKQFNMKDTILGFQMDKLDKYGVDQSFLVDVYRKYITDYLSHDEFFEKNPFPIKRENGRFIGERINVNEEPLTKDHLILL